MKLMTILDGIELINKIKKVNEGDIEYVKIQTCSGKPVDFKEFEEVITNSTREVVEDEWDKSCITINGFPLLKEWDRLDVDTINVHVPLNIIEVKREED